MFGSGNFDKVPWFVWAIIGTYFVAFNTFPINMILQYKKVGKWKDYIYGERVLYCFKPCCQNFPCMACSFRSNAAMSKIQKIVMDSCVFDTIKAHERILINIIRLPRWADLSLVKLTGAEDQD